MSDPIIFKSHPALERRFWSITCLSFGAAYVCSVWAVFYIAKRFDDKILRGYLILASGVGGAALVFAAARLSYVPRAFLKLTLSDGGFTYDRDGRLFEVPFEHVTGLAVRWFGSFRRLRVSMRNGRAFEISFAVQGLESLARAVFTARPDIATQAEREELLRRIRLAEFRTARAYDPAPGGLVLFGVKYLVFPAVVGVLVPAGIKCFIDRGLAHAIWYNAVPLIVIPIIAATALTWVAGFLLELLLETLIARRDRSLGLIDLARDMVFEAKARSWTTTLFFVGGTLYFAISFLRFISGI